MQIVIKISKEDYERLKEYEKAPFYSLTSRVYEAIANGTPLPKGHGKLVDVKQVIMALVYRHLLKDDVTCGDVTKILNMATIIEADKEGAEE